MNLSQLQQAQPGQPPVDPQDGPDDGPADTDGADGQDSGTTNSGPNAKPASPQMQAQFDLLLGRCRQIMEKAAQEWISAIQKSPVDGAVTLGTTTLRHMVMASTQAGQPVDPTVLLNVGVQLVKDVAAIANAAGVVPDAQLPQYLQQVMQQSMAQYLQMDAKEGLLSPQDKALGSDIVSEGKEDPAEEASETPQQEEAEDAQEPPEPGTAAEPPENGPPGLLAQLQRKGARK
jgi:hypothetical protein